MTQATESESPAAGAYVPNPKVAFEQSPKWVRVFLNGVAIADSKRAHLLYQRGRTPDYYFPKDDVKMEHLVSVDRPSRRPSLGNATCWTVKVGDSEAVEAAWSYTDPRPEVEYLKDYVTFDFGAMDAWFEEEEQIYVHPRDPYKRVDVIPSSRHIRVEIDGVTVGETSHPTLLFETGLPTRYYFPKTDIRTDLLVSSHTVTSCPYKGDAQYYSLKSGDDVVADIAWWYPFPTLESAGIAGLVSFYNEHVDTFLDGELVQRPKTPWS